LALSIRSLSLRFGPDPWLLAGFESSETTALSQDKLLSIQIYILSHQHKK